MTRIEVKNSKPRKPGSDLWVSDDGSQVFIGRDYALQSEIDEAKRKTVSRACYKECRTCGCCSESRRDTSYPYRFDANAGKNKNCITCEPFRFHDCNNGFMRNSRGEAEPFTEDQQRLIDESGGKPLI